MEEPIRELRQLRFYHCELSPCTITIRSNGDASNTDGGRRAVFLEHVRAVASYARAAHSVQPLMWDDMLRAVPAEELRRAQLGRLVEPVVWAYGESVDAQGGTGQQRVFLGLAV